VSQAESSDARKTGRFVGPKTLEVRLNDGGTRTLAGDQVFLNV
jgi:hypothetical protein